MKKTTVQIEVKCNNQITLIPIDGYQITPYLAVHKPPTKEYMEWCTEETSPCKTQIPMYEQPGLWHITHLPTGRSIFKCPTRRDAVEVVERIKNLLDWSDSVQTLYSLEFHQVCYEARLEGLIISYIPNPERYKVV